MSHERAIRAMAQDIQALAGRFPQLADFDAERRWSRAGLPPDISVRTGLGELLAD